MDDDDKVKIPHAKMERSEHFLGAEDAYKVLRERAHEIIDSYEDGGFVIARVNSEGEVVGLAICLSPAIPSLEGDEHEKLLLAYTIKALSNVEYAANQQTRSIIKANSAMIRNIGQDLLGKLADVFYEGLDSFEAEDG